MKFNQQTISLLKTLYENGKTIPEIIKLTGKSEYGIRTNLKTLGIYDPKRDQNHTKYTNLDFFENINTEEKAYWLGFIEADGSVSDYDKTLHKTMRLAVSLKDEEHLKTFAKIFNRNLYYRQNAVILDINSCEIWQDLINLGILPGKTYLDNSNIIKNVPDNLINHFVRGVFDGDGSIFQSNQNNYSFNLVGSEGLITQINNIFIKNIPYLTDHPINRAYNSDVIVGLRYGGRIQLEAIANWMYNNSTIYLNRKKDIFDRMLFERYNFIDRQNPPYKGARKQKLGTTWNSRTVINENVKNINCSTELEAAYYYDLEQVRQRGDEAKRYMNFPSKYDDFVQWVNEGY